MQSLVWTGEFRSSKRRERRQNEAREARRPECTFEYMRTSSPMRNKVMASAAALKRIPVALVMEG